MFADPKKNGARRIKRQLKAGASILLALAAGTFLACKGKREPDAPSPYGPDARSGPGAVQAVDTPTSSQRQGNAGRTHHDIADSGATDADLAVRDAGASATHGARAPHIDRQEHRNGMPVRDNLLE
jgi:hypothetical protein